MLRAAKKQDERLLLVNLREAHALFKEGSKLKVGFSKFVSLRLDQTDTRF